MHVVTKEPTKIALCLPLVALGLLLGAGCATVDVKGRETLRVAPLRGEPTAPASVDMSPIVLDAGSDALTDAELNDIAASLPKKLAQDFDRLAQEHGAKRAGEARVFKCRLRAGPGRLHTVYEAQCRVRVVVDGTPLVEVNSEAIRRTRARAISQEEAERIKKLERNPLLDAGDSRAVLEAALETAAQLIVAGALPRREEDPPLLTRKERAALAREKLANGGNVRVALFELGESGTIADAKLVLPFLEDADAQVRAAALGALGELCDPETAPRVESFVADEDENVQRAATKALAQIKACETL